MSAGVWSCALRLRRARCLSEVPLPNPEIVHIKNYFNSMGLTANQRLSRSTFHLNRHGHGFRLVRAPSREVCPPPLPILILPEAETWSAPRSRPWPRAVRLWLAYRPPPGSRRRKGVYVLRRTRVGPSCPAWGCAGGPREWRRLRPRRRPRGVSTTSGSSKRYGVAVAGGCSPLVPPGGWECSAPVAAVSPSRRRSLPLLAVCALGVLFSL